MSRAGSGVGWVGVLVLVLAVGLVVPSWPFGDGEAEAQAAAEAVAPVCRAGYSFDSGSSLCVKTEFGVPERVCVVGTRIGHRGGVSCRVDHGAAVLERSCGEGELVYVGPPTGGAWRCAVASTRTETTAPTAYCTPSGTPPGCRYTVGVSRTETVAAIPYCSPRGTGSSCEYTAQVARTLTEAAIGYCSPRGAPPSCRYTAQVSRTETRPATAYCSPRGSLPFCRYTATETKPATLVYLGTMPVGYVCASGWKLSGSTCSRRVTRYGTVAYRCSSGWSLSGSTCSRTVTDTVNRTGTLKYRCKAGWSRSGSTCSRSTTVTVTRYGTLRYRCRPGPWSLSGTTCSRSVTDTVTRTGTLRYRCPAGWAPSGFTCERSIAVTRYDEPTLTATCTTGTPTGGRCYTHELAAKICDTANRWQLVGDSCIRTDTHTPTCPAGFPDLRDGHCHSPPTTTTTAPPPTTVPPTTVPPTTTTTQPVRPPGAPESLVLVPGDGQLTARWQPPTDNGGAPVTYYLLEYTSDITSTDWPRAVIGANTGNEQSDGTVVVSHTITGLTNGITHVVRVGAINAADAADAAGIKWNYSIAKPRATAAQVRINGLDGAARIGTGTLTEDFTVTPPDADCNARVVYPPGGNPPTGLGPTVTLSDNTGPSRTVTVATTSIGSVTVQVTCTRDRHADAVKSAVFAATAADPCALALTWTAKAMIYKGEWSTSCTSKKRSNTQTAFHAWRYIFRLPTATTVAIDLKSSENAYLYLWGTSDDGTKVDLHNDDIGTTTNRDSRLSLRLQPGTYTIETTTFKPRTTGKFTLIVAPITTDTAHHATVGEHWATAFESPATPSLQTVTPPGLELTLTHSNTAATATATTTVEGTPKLAGTYNATFAFAGGLGTARRTITITVTCPMGHTQRSDRSCQDPLDAVPSDLVVPADPPHGHRLYQVSQAALVGMVQAADSMTNKFQNECPRIPETRYRLTRNLIVALLVSIQFHELYQDPDGKLPTSLMDLSRGDYFHQGVTWRHKSRNLYSFKNTNNYENAFWHPGVGLWQLDDANYYASGLNHAERAHAARSATTAVEIIYNNYCRGTREADATAVAHLKDSLWEAAWVACSSKEKGQPRVSAKCYPTLERIVKGGPFPDSPNTQNLDLDRLYDGRLYLKVHKKLTHVYDGGVEKLALMCKWRAPNSDGTPFDCYKYDIGLAQSYVRLRNSPSGFSGYNSEGDPTGRSPLAFPFLSFTDKRTSSHMKYIVFKADTNDDGVKTGYDRDLIARVPVGRDVRIAPTKDSPHFEFYDPENGWWHENTVNGSSLVIME